MPTRLTAASLGGLPIQIDTLARDYESLREVLIALIPTLTPEWTDFFEADPGIVLVELMAYIGSAQQYATDRVQNESYLLTAQQRSAVVDLLRLIGYELPPGSAAQVPMVVQIDTPLTLSASYAVRSEASANSPSLTFELLNAVTLPSAGYWAPSSVASAVSNALGVPVNVSDDLVFVHGVSINAENLGVSNGQSNQRFTLARSPLALNPDGSSPLVVRVAAVTWTQVETFLEAEPTDQVYRILIDANGEVQVIFGDGINGRIPLLAASIDTDYRIGGGSDANSVGVSRVTTQVSPVAGVLQIFNPVQPSGGADAQSNNDAKRLGPLSLRALNRAVTLEDFETLALQTPGGGIVSARASQADSPFRVAVYVAAEGANPVPPGVWYPELDTGTGTIGAVGRFLTERKAVPVQLEVSGPTIVRPFLEADIQVQKNILRRDAEFTVRSNLATLFNTFAADFGIGVPQSRVYQEIENTRGVDWVNIVAFHRKPAARFVAGNELAFINAQFSVTDLNPQTVVQNYTLRWSNANTYQLFGDEYGVITDQNDRPVFFNEGTIYQINHFTKIPLDTLPDRRFQFTFSVTLLGPTPLPGDEWIFGVDNYTGNIAIREFEMLRSSVPADQLLDPTEFVLRFGGGIG